MVDTVQKQRQARRVVVVLGVGRSGTSLAVQALEKLGVRISENLIPANNSNPKGFGEDADIVNIHARLLKSLTPTQIMPLQEGWLKAPEANEALEQLKILVEQQVDAGPEIWAFKDPRTATFLPLWIRLFNQLNIVPRFILAIRNPGAVISSSAKQYGNEQDFVELLFLLRTLDALHHTGGDCHLLPYEEWLSKPASTLQNLASFVLGQPICLREVDVPVVPELNRSSGNYVKVNSPLVLELYKSLKSYASGEMERDNLMALVKKQREILASFIPWCNFAYKQEKDKLRFQKQAMECHKQLQGQQNCESQLQHCRLSSREWQQVASAFERLLYIEQ